MLRTGITTFDMVLVHDLDTFIHTEPAEFKHHYATAIGGAMRALQELKGAGVIRAIGIGLNEAPTCARFIRDAELDCVLLAGRYTLLDQSACDEVVPLCKLKGIGLIAGGPFNSGILAGIPGPGSAYNYADAPRDVIAKALCLREIAKVHGTSLHAAALRCALTSSVVTSVIPGARDAHELDAVLASHGSRVPAEFWTAAQQAGLLREDMSIDCAERDTV
jgi:D-threo-aldose 1-dehydrogenase